MQQWFLAFLLALAGLGTAHGARPVFDDEACLPDAPGVLLDDDNLADDGYFFPADLTSVRLVEKFTPASYPAAFTRVCVSLFSDAGVEALDFDVLVYKDDGANGGPGTLLASVSASGRVLQLLGHPFTPRFTWVDIADLDLTVESGSVYIGLRWNPSRNDGDKVYLSADVSPGTAPGEARVSFDEGDWVPGVEALQNYRALMIRVVAEAGGPRAPWLRTRFDPARVMNDETSRLSVRLSNVSQPSPAVLAEAFVDVLPAGLVIAPVPNATTTCAGEVEAVPGGGSFALKAGASIPAERTCTIDVAVTAATSAHYDHTIPAGALKTQHGSNAEAAEAQLHVGFVFPEPYCNAEFFFTSPITRVRFADIDKSSDAAFGGSPSLEDFRDAVGHVAPGQALPMAVKGATQGSAVVTAFADWNHDLDFDDPGETYALGELPESDGLDAAEVVADVAVPSTATAGATRLRVTLMSGGAAEACNWIGFGQAEDYTLQVGGDRVFANGFDG